MQIHIMHDGGKWEVWLDTDAGKQDGICLSADASALTAIEHGKRVLVRAIEALNEGLTITRTVEED